MFSQEAVNLLAQERLVFRLQFRFPVLESGEISGADVTAIEEFGHHFEDCVFACLGGETKFRCYFVHCFFVVVLVGRRRTRPNLGLAASEFLVVPVGNGLSALIVGIVGQREDRRASRAAHRRILPWFKTF